LIAVTGTPGTGKTSACDVLASRGYDVRSLLELAKDNGTSRASKGGEFIIDVDSLRNKLDDLREGKEKILVDGHLSHHLGPDLCVVLRCSPDILERRLAPRKYPSKKLRENVEAEAIDLVLVEAIERCEDTYEIDATEKSAEEVANDIELIMNGDRRRYNPGKVDWSEVVMSWY